MLTQGCKLDKGLEKATLHLRQQRLAWMACFGLKSKDTACMMYQKQHKINKQKNQQHNKQARKLSNLRDLKMVAEEDWSKTPKPQNPTQKTLSANIRSISLQLC